MSVYSHAHTVYCLLGNFDLLSYVSVCYVLETQQFNTNHFPASTLIKANYQPIK